MKTTLTYVTKCCLDLEFVDNYHYTFAHWREQYDTLKDAIDAAENILTHIYPLAVKSVFICDDKTGVMLAKCEQD